MTQREVTAEQTRAPGTFDLDSDLVEDLEALIEAGERGMVLNIIADLHAADLALLLAHLPFDEAQQLFRWLPVEQAGEVLAELEDDFRAELLEEEPTDRLSAMIDELDSDDAADVLADLPEDVAQEVLTTLEDAEEVQELLGYEEDTAGGIMAREYVAVPISRTVAEALDEVRQHADAVDDLYGVFAVDDKGRLKGVVSLKKLIVSPPEARIADIMDSDVESVTAGVDQEEVARLMERYDLVSLPVVDEEGRLIGRITIDDVVDVIREEAEEDIQRMSGVAGGEEPTDSVIRVVRGRLPWILAGMVGSAVAAFVIGYFSGTLQAVPVLASFIPIVMATAGNAGVQSSAIAVQGLASGDVWSSDLYRRMGRELLVGLLNGLSAAFVIGLIILAVGMAFPERIERPFMLVLTAGLSLVIVIVMATLIGAAIPLLLDRLGVDPAIATGPFITVSNDILGTLVFFLLATQLYVG